MAKIERVIEVFECLLDIDKPCEDTCSYNLGDCGCDTTRLYKETLELLKEQKSRISELEEQVKENAKLCKECASEAVLEQQPRVLTKAEMADFLDNIVWYETKDQNNTSEYFALVEGYSLKHEAVWLQLISCDGNNRLSTSDYGINWRVWSARPTDEQRKAVPWKDGEQE